MTARDRALLPEGVGAGLELVGSLNLPDTLKISRIDGKVCFAEMLSNQWTAPDSYSIEYIPAAFGSQPASTPTASRQAL
ncbi:hypothetical protein [Arthrobacter nitrophenolicus]|uniref:hypothetical protein n=1 Tax=Arthrobacter nitrophenolicus TaxID=683150 RepID=UPI0014051C24|nr:hypothetical protein [Arthrobacter nitrophenolicus]